MKPHSCACCRGCPDTARYSSGAYGAYSCLPVNKHRGRQGRRGEQKRWAAFSIARQVEQACEARKGLLHDGWGADAVACAGVPDIGLDLIHLHVFGIPR